MYELPELYPNTSHTYYIVSVDSHDNQSEPASITVQACISIFPPSSVSSSCSIYNENTITWEPPLYGLTPASYAIYSDAYLTDLVATVPGYGPGPFMYELPELYPNTSHTYYIVSVDSHDNQSEPASITVQACISIFPPSSVSSSCPLLNNTIMFESTIMEQPLYDTMSPTSYAIITWDAPLYGTTPTEYAIYSDPYLTYLVATIPGYGPGPFTYELTGLEPNTSYTYYLVSIDSRGDQSEPVSITVEGCAPPSPTTPLSPTNLTGTRTRNTFFLQTDLINTITWSAPSSGPTPVSYNIYRDPALTKLIGTVPATGPLQFNAHNRQPNVTYTYYITAVDAAGNQSSASSVSMLG
jgi:hypothetical protein